MVGLILCLGWVCVHLVWKGKRPRLRQDGPRDAHSPRLSFLEAKALKQQSLCGVPVSIGSTDSISCSKVARAQLVIQGVRSLPSGVRAFGWNCRGHLIVPPGPSSSGLVTGLGQKCLHMYSPYKDQTMHRPRAVCIAIPTNGVNIVPLMAVSLGLTGGLALETKARRHSWRLFARAEAVVSYSSGLCLLRLPIEITRTALFPSGPL